MTESITVDVLDDFYDITKFDVQKFFEEYVDFNDNEYPKISNYFSNLSDVVPQSSFAKLSSLTSMSKELIDIVSANNVSLSAYKYWVVLEYVEDIIGALGTANNASRWLRSNKINYHYSQTTTVDYVTSQGESLEAVQAKMGSNDEDDWVQSSLVNQLREEDYTPAGGFYMKVNFKNGGSINLQSVVDNIDSSQKTYGLDIARSLSMVNNDLKVLPYRDTIVQAAEIIAGLKRGDNPTFPLDGYDPKLVVGSSLAGALYPIVFRQLAATFSKDDTFKSFGITDVKKSESTQVFFQVETRAGDVFTQSIGL